MADRKPASPDKQITIGGKSLTLRFSARAVMALQDLWGLETEEEVMARLAKPKSKIGDFVDVLWASFRTHHPELSREEVLEMIDAEGLDGLAASAQEVISAAMPPPNAGKPGDPPAAAARKPR